MLKHFLVASLFLSAHVQAQTFKMTDARRANFEVCQVNHNIILDKFIKQADSQLARMIVGVDIEQRAYTPKAKIDKYKSVLVDTVIKKIIYSEIKRQFNRENLNTYLSKKGNFNKPFINDSIILDIDAKAEQALKEIKNVNQIKVGKDFLNGIKKDILKEVGKMIISKQFRQIGAGVLSRIVGKSTGTVVTGQVLKSAAVSFGSKLFVSVSQGILLELLTMPLHGYRLPPETLWTDLLDEYPELIIMPEWMRYGGVHDHPWMTHCNTIQRQTKRLEKLMNKALDLEEKEFINRLSRINDWVEEITPTGKKDDLLPPPVKVDNTYVKKPVILRGSVPPFWAK